MNKKKSAGQNADSYADEGPGSSSSNDPRNRPPVRQSGAERFQRPSYKYTTIPPAEEKKYRPTTSPGRSTALGKEAVRRSPRHSCCGCGRESQQNTRPRTVGPQCQCRLTQGTIEERATPYRRKEGRAQGRCIVPRYRGLCQYYALGFRGKASLPLREIMHDVDGDVGNWSQRRPVEETGETGKGGFFATDCGDRTEFIIKTGVFQISSHAFLRICRLRVG